MAGSRPPKTILGTACLSAMPPAYVLFGHTEAMGEVRRMLERVAALNVPILIFGESGTGKEVLARWIHDVSPWSAGPFVKISCPAIPATLIESELFGYERGSFTGAYNTKPGWVELAEAGTLFLDEIAELEIAVQAKLLHLLQNGDFYRIGGQEARRAELRVLCATNRALEEEIERGNFRRDLFYRINVFSVRMPALRERRSDIPQIAEYLLELFNEQYQRRARPVPPRLLSLMMRHDWPGNIRELENVIRSYVVLNSDEAITNGLLGSAQSRAGTATVPAGTVRCLKEVTREAVEELEREVIVGVLRSNNWNRRKAARTLNISYRSLFYKMKAIGIPTKRKGPQAESSMSQP